MAVLLLAAVACGHSSTEDLLRAAANGDAAAMEELQDRVVTTMQEQGAVLQDLAQKQVAELEELAAGGTEAAAEAALELSHRFQQGSTEFRKWLGQAADGGAREAQFLLGKYRLHGLAGFAKDADSGRALLQTAADEGHAEAAFTLGIAYKYGLDVPEDHAKAKALLQQARDNGFVAADDELQGLDG